MKREKKEDREQIQKGITDALYGQPIYGSLASPELNKENGSVDGHGRGDSKRMVSIG